MAYSTPHTAVTGATITASGHNTSIRDNIEYLKGRAGTVAIESGATFNGNVQVLTGGLTLPSTGTGGINCAAGDIMVNRAYLGGGNGATGYLILGNDTGKYLGFDGTKHLFVTPELDVQNDLYVYRSATPTQGYVILGNNNARYVGWNGTTYVFGGNQAWHSANDGTGSGLDADLVDGAHAGNASGNVALSNGTLCTNLNADLLDGLNSGNGSGAIPISNSTMNTGLYANWARLVIDSGANVRDFGNASGNIPIANATRCVNLNADQLDGLDSTAFALLTGANFTGAVTSTGDISAAGNMFSAGYKFTANDFFYSPNPQEVGWATNGVQRFRQTNTTAIFATAGTYVGTWTAVSDRRLKTDVTRIESALERIRMLRPVTYIPSAAGIGEGMIRGQRLPGLIAQELADVFPDLVGQRRGVDPSETFLTADYVGLVPYLAAALVELSDKVDSISARLAA